ncbi:unnamed protein product [Blumeria hordei]|uniref:Uncharacterized protein n=1 Tax=Blumeria hordei TaxID=2867405 RepID=A0A383V0L0_BLUHO|nr:unnamed protein product [Blumeria hordei]
MPLQIYTLMVLHPLAIHRFKSHDAERIGAPAADNNDSCEHHTGKQTHPATSSPIKSPSCHVVQSLVSSPTKKLSYPVSIMTHSCIHTQRDAGCEEKPPSPNTCVEVTDPSSNGCKHTNSLGCLLESSMSRLTDKSLCLMSSRISYFPKRLPYRYNLTRNRHFSTCACKFVGNETHNCPRKCTVCMDNIGQGNLVKTCESEAGW